MKFDRPAVPRARQMAFATALMLSACIAESSPSTDDPADIGTGGAGGGAQGGTGGRAPVGGEGGRPVEADTGVVAGDAGPIPPDAAAPAEDQDQDGVADAADNCPGAPNARQSDADADGLGDACDVGDTDGDGAADRDDLCPSVAGPTGDTDADGVGDACDVCPELADPGQADADADGIGDACEIPNDDDADGVPDARDNCPTRANGAQADADQDGVGDACDRCPADPDPAQLDSDGDDLGDACDACPQVAVVAENHVDRDGDGYPTCADDCDDTDPNRYAGAPELCDGRDNDCDPSIDEDYPDLGEPCTAGLGACLREGVRGCAGGDGGTTCLAVPGAPAAEVCNDLDDDCDGSADEGLVGCCEPGETSACGADAGVCRPGNRTCRADRSWSVCDGIEPTPETCDGRDQDCNGLVDDGFDLDRDPHNCGFCGNVCPGGGCRDGACFDARDVVLLCGGSGRPIEEFTRHVDGVVAAMGCTPDGTTQAMLVSRAGLEPANGAWAEYVQNGGNILTEYNISDEVFLAVTGIPVVQPGQHSGNCQDNVMPEVLLSPDDPIWTEVPFVATPPGQGGCGFNLAAYPGIVPLGGWMQPPGSVSLAYRDVGAGRLWLVEADWQDREAGLSLDSARLMAAMIAWPRNPSVTECSDGVDNDADGRIDFPDDPGCRGALSRLECTDTPASCLGVALDPIQGYGHHGSCDGWNGCIDAEGCANMACEFAGFDAAASWREAHCSDPGLVCNLFVGNGMLDRDLDLGNCNLPVATEVVCR